MRSRWDDELFQEHEPAQPAAFGPERAGQEAGEAPEVAYVLRGEWTPGDENILVELRELADGQIALLAYSSLESLVEKCGRAQPWVAVHVGELDEVLNSSAARVVLWDQTLPAEQRQE